MRLLLTHAYFLQDDPREQRIMKPYAPLGMLCISAWLEENKVDHEVYDTTFSSFDDLKKYLLDFRPDHIGIYVNLMTRPNVIKLITFIRGEDSLKKMNIILGGPEVRNHAIKFLEHGSDFLVLGEGEESFLELIQTIEEKRNQDLINVRGICFINDNGDVFFTPERPKIRELDVLPLPNRKKINMHAYLDAWKDHHGKNAISVSTMRGCPYTCKWCSRAVYGLSYRRRNAGLVVNELMQIKKEYNPDSFWFVDDVFTISHNWLKEFAEEINKNNLEISYECITRADRMNEEVIQLLKQSGCFRVWIGAESGSQKVIDLMDRRVDVTQVREMIRLTRNYGIEAGTFIMLGYPGEDEKDIVETVRHLKSSNPDHFTITVAYPIKGTEMYTEVESDIISAPDWESGTDRQIDFKRKYSGKYYEYAVRYVVNEVNYFKNRLPAFKLKSSAARVAMWWIRVVGLR